MVKLDAFGHHLWSRVRAPVRSLAGIAADSKGNVFVSGAYPGDASPFRTLLLMELDAKGYDLGMSTSLDAKLTAEGAGHGVALSRCDDLLWSLTMAGARDPSQPPQSFLAKLAP